MEKVKSTIIHLGKKITVDGSKYIGFFANNQLFGNGKIIFSNGVIESGKYTYNRITQGNKYIYVAIINYYY